MKRFRKMALLAGLVAAAWGLTTPEEARADVHIGLGFFASPPPVYYYPAPVYAAPAYPYPVYRHYHYAPRPHYYHHHHHHHGWCW